MTVKNDELTNLRSFVTWLCDLEHQDGGKAIHPSSRKAKQISRLECHAGRVVKKRQNTKAKFNHLRDRFQWFKDQLNENQTQLTREEMNQLVEQYLNRFENELEQIEIKNQIGQRQKTPQHTSRKALIDTTITTERHEFETNGIEIPNLTQAEGVRELRIWDGTLRFMPRLKICAFKKMTSNSTKEDPIVPIDIEADSIENDH